MRGRAWFIDLYPIGSEMIVWFIAETGERLRLADPFTPSFFLEGLRALDKSGRLEFWKTLEALPGFAWVGPTARPDLWTGRPREVFEIAVTNMDHIKTSLRGLFRRYPGLTYYNCDIAPEIHYCYDRGIFPTARCEIETEGTRLVSCRVLDDPYDTELELPPLREAELSATGELAGRRPFLRSLTFAHDGRSITWEDCPPSEMLSSLAEAVREADPDLIWTRGGDSVLMPALFSLAARCNVPLELDREPRERNLVLDGHSFMSYGRVLYQAPDYPLFGRWHIDGENSFWSSETGLEGLIEVARLSKLPVQRAARRSIGTGISSIQLDYAYRQGVLIPWKKSQPEAWKSAATLLKSDRGGLVYQPITGVYEDVVELDFVSMYPSIMVRCNVSPETVGCSCCPPEPVVPEIGYSICRKRRGLTSIVLEPIIEKRKRYKALMKNAATPDEKRSACDGRQGAIKWLLVCCFGYLGYRNARFGRIEAHESTCAFSREKLIQAKEVCEERGCEVLHAIVDCFWLRKPGITNEEVAGVCREIERVTGLDIAVEGRYRWIAFLPSRQDPEMPVPNRYFGLFDNGKLKFRGIEIRRHDQAPYAQEVQGHLLEMLRGADNLKAVREMKAELLAVAREAEERLRQREVSLDKLVMRRKTSMEAGDYKSRGMTAVAARQAARAGVSLHAGEAVHFIVLNAKDRDPDSRLRLVSLLRPEDNYDVEYYIEQVRRAAATVLEPLLGEPLPSVEEKVKKRGTRRERSSSKIRDKAQADLFEGVAFA